MVRNISEDASRAVRGLHSARYEDNISKKMADIRMSPWRGDEIDSEYKNAMQSKARISGLERELNEITRNSMSYRYKLNTEWGFSSELTNWLTVTGRITSLPKSSLLRLAEMMICLIIQQRRKLIAPILITLGSQDINPPDQLY